MEYNIVSLIDILGVVQGIILGLLFIISNRTKDKSTLFLGLFILAYALDLIPVIVHELGITSRNPEFELLPFSFGWLLFPLFYVYVQQISIIANNKTSYKTLVPGLLFFLISIILFFLKPETKISIADSFFYNLLHLAGFVYGIVIGFKILIWIRLHTQELKNQYTETEFKELKWARLYVIIGITFSLLIMLSNFMNDNIYIDITISSINVLLLYWISLRGIMQKNVQSIVPVEKETVLEHNTNIALQSDQNTNTTSIEKIEQYIMQENVYTKPDLTIIDLADAIGMHPRRVSDTVNSLRNKNFNAFINEFRIQHAIELIQSDVSNTLSIEGIANEVGFKSRSAFYNAFKKVTGTTPTLYKKN